MKNAVSMKYELLLFSDYEKFLFLVFSISNSYSDSARVDVCARPSSQSMMVVEKLEQEMGVKGEMMNW
jgi:hypothetical protein